MLPRVTAIHPLLAIEGGRVIIEGADFPVDEPTLPEVWIGGARAGCATRLACGLVCLVNR